MKGNAMALSVEEFHEFVMSILAEAESDRTVNVSLPVLPEATVVVNKDALTEANRQKFLANVRTGEVADGLRCLEALGDESREISDEEMLAAGKAFLAASVGKALGVELVQTRDERARGPTRVEDERVALES